MNYLAYLHSIWITQSKLSTIFENNYDYKRFYENLSHKTLWKYYSKTQDIEKILDTKSKFNQKIIDINIKNLWVKFITINDNAYPKWLKQISNPPYFLYVRWTLENIWECLSIVGSRKNTTYSKKVASSIIPELVPYFTIVSGGAWGCDTLAHQITVETKWKTLVVFWTWIDITYPSGNRELFEKVIENKWALISIFPIWTPGGAYTFPVRNQIVAGISKWLLVLEAGESSGTLITANLALDYSRDVFCIPGDIFNPNYVWTNNLIKTWTAKLITKSDDILEEYNFKVISKEKEVVFNNEIEGQIYNLLKYNLSLSIDELIEKTWMSYGELSLNLSMMELWGLIKKDIFGKYEI